MIELIDTHAHLDFDDYDKDREKVLEKAETAGVSTIVNIGSDISGSRKSLELSQQYHQIYAVVGLHPHNAGDFNKKTLGILKDLAKADKVVAVGEIGLDYHYDNSPRAQQQKAFRAQLNLARELGLPVVIHTREADARTIEIMKEEKAEEIGGIFHCFAGDRSIAEKAREWDFYLGIGGLLTFNNAENIRKIAADFPLEKIILETDSPFLSPEPYRGHRNQPAYVKQVAEKISEIKSLPLSEVAEATTANARKVYNI